MALKKYKGVNYYSGYEAARTVRDKVKSKGWPGARVIEFDRGWAVQYFKGGPFYPELPEWADPRAKNPCTTRKRNPCTPEAKARAVMANPSRGRLPKAARELAIEHKIQLGRAELTESGRKKDWYYYIIKTGRVTDTTRSRRPTAANALALVKRNIPKKNPCTPEAKARAVMAKMAPATNPRMPGAGGRKTWPRHGYRGYVIAALHKGRTVYWNGRGYSPTVWGSHFDAAVVHLKKTGEYIAKKAKRRAVVAPVMMAQTEIGKALRGG